MRLLLIPILLCLAGSAAHAQGSVCGERDDAWLIQLLESAPDRFGEIMENADEHRIQILVTEFADDGSCVRESGYRVDAEYFYPASAIKVVGAVAALRWAQTVDNVDLDTEIDVDGDGVTLRSLIERTLIVSHNQTFNRLFDIAGHDEMNQVMWDAGLSSARLQRRLYGGMTTEENRRLSRGGGRRCGATPRTDVDAGPATPRRSPDGRRGRVRIRE